MKNILSWVSLITGVLPGIAVILNGFGTPEELKQPFGITAAVCGFVAFGLVAFIKESVTQRSRKLLAGISVAFGLIGLVSLCSYWIVLDQCAFHSPSRSSAFFPLWLNGSAREIVDRAGGRKAFYEKYGAGAVSTLLESQSNELERTKWLLLTLILTASISLPVASGIAPTFDVSRPPGNPSNNEKNQVSKGSCTKGGD